jgi:hypothetical protein
MPQPNDLSRSLVALDQNSAIIAVIAGRQAAVLGSAPAFCAADDRNPAHSAAGPDRLIPPAMRSR